MKLVVARAWSTLALEMSPTALPPVGEELLTNEQLVKEATFVMTKDSSDIRLSWEEDMYVGGYSSFNNMTNP